MKVNESKEKELSLAGSAIQTAKQGIQFSSEHLNTLNMGPEEEEGEENEGGAPGADPTKYMNAKEKRIWNRLADGKKRRYMEKGMKRAGHSFREGQAAQEAGETASELFRQEEVRQGTRQGQGGQMPQQSGGGRPKQAGTRNGHRGSTKPGAGPSRRAGPEGKEAAGGTSQSIRQSGPPHMNEGPKGTAGPGPLAAAPGAGTAVTPGGEAAAGAAASSTAAGTATAAAGGAGVAIRAGKKAAEIFKNAVEAHSMAVQKGLQEAQGKMEQLRAENQGMETPKQAAVFAMASVAAFTLLAVQLIVSAMFSIVVMMVFALVALLAAIFLITVVASVIISIISVRADGQGGEDIVKVALGEEGAEDGTKYWEYTMGTAFVDGNETPWCACFVSWCANECGYIEKGIFPKSASVATYRGFYRDRGLLVEPDGYTPKAGDLILFGSDDHIGIVQFSELGRVVTIEGNTSDAVYTRSYLLGDANITGYCTPAYPDNADFTGDSHAEVAYNFLRSQGCTRECAAAILGNLQQESGINPDSRQPGGPGRGICQWEEGGGRFEALSALAAQEGKEWNDLSVQLRFMWDELNGGDSTCLYILNRDYGGIENLKNATDIGWAVEAFEKSFERAGMPMMEKRIQYAYEFYEQFG